MSLDFSLELDVDTGAKPLRITVFSANYTHNVTPMWRLVNCYTGLYESDGEPAGKLVPALSAACRRMRDRIAECRALNPSNGWGHADGALRFLGRVTAACKRYPRAKVSVCR